MKDLSSRLEALRERIRLACLAAGREVESVRLLAVSKRQPVAAIRALRDLGQVAFGENYVQEARDKQEALADLDIEWHFIGPVQSNKTGDLARHFHWVQSVDRVKIVRRLDEQRPEGLPPLNVCLQVNVDDEPQKAGVHPDEVADLADQIDGRGRLRLRGLMAIPAPHDDPDDMRPAFARLRSLFRSLAGAGHALDTLSMGMSADLEAAIAEGSTMIRVGTDLMGPRPNGGRGG